MKPIANDTVSSIYHIGEALVGMARLTIPAERKFERYNKGVVEPSSRAALGYFGRSRQVGQTCLMKPVAVRSATPPIKNPGAWPGFIEGHGNRRSLTNRCRKLRNLGKNRYSIYPRVG